MVVALIVSIVVVCLSGIMMGLAAFWGEAWVEDLNVAATCIAIALVALLVEGVALASLEHRETLVRAMITGRKRDEPRSRK